MKAGLLRHKITIQSKAETQSDSGAVTETWSNLATVHARITPTGGIERWQGDVPEAARIHDIEIRYLSTVTVDMRIVFGSRTFYIKEVINPDERKIRMILKAEEKLS